MEKKGKKKERKQIYNNSNFMTTIPKSHKKAEMIFFFGSQQYVT